MSRLLLSTASRTSSWYGRTIPGPVVRSAPNNDAEGMCHAVARCPDWDSEANADGKPLRHAALSCLRDVARRANPLRSTLSLPSPPRTHLTSPVYRPLSPAPLPKIAPHPFTAPAPSASPLSDARTPTIDSPTHRSPSPNQTVDRVGPLLVRLEQTRPGILGSGS